MLIHPYKGHELVSVFPWYEDRVDRIAKLLRDSGYSIRVTREEARDLPDLFFTRAPRDKEGGE